MPSRIEMLNDEQKTALEKIKAWLADKSAPPYFLLEGFAGTGKTFAMQALADEIKGRIVFTAPTNKATKVLRDRLKTKDYTPECRTIYSLLGLKLEPNGEVKELSFPEDPIDLTQYALVGVDEASMVNNPVLGHIQTAANTTGVKFLFMGDSAQLPPVGETKSGVWDIEDKAKLETVMRHDNQILALATKIRKVVDHPAPTFKPLNDNDNKGGVFLCPSAMMFEARVREMAANGGFLKPNGEKVIAWRNVRVDAFNKIIRHQLYGPEVPTWVEGDRGIFTAPAKDLDDNVVATTDDEGTITRVVEDWHPIYREFKIWRITITLDDNKVIAARVLHEEHLQAYNNRVERLAAEAKADKRKWRHFWDFKDSFHGLRHAYAITAHRSQGSTYDTVFVDWRDVLLNQNRQEAFRCLYVACTRPKRRLYLG